MDTLEEYENRGSHIAMTFKDSSGFIAQVRIDWEVAAQLQELLTASLDEHNSR